MATTDRSEFGPGLALTRMLITKSDVDTSLMKWWLADYVEQTGAEHRWIADSLRASQPEVVTAVWEAFGEKGEIALLPFHRARQCRCGAWIGHALDWHPLVLTGWVRDTDDDVVATCPTCAGMEGADDGDD